MPRPQGMMMRAPCLFVLALSTACGDGEAQAENDWAQARVSAPTWIGANDLNVEGEWHWTDQWGSESRHFFCERTLFLGVPPIVTPTCELLGIPCDAG